MFNLYRVRDYLEEIVDPIDKFTPGNEISLIHHTKAFLLVAHDIQNSKLKNNYTHNLEIINRVKHYNQKAKTIINEIEWEKNVENLRYEISFATL